MFHVILTSMNIPLIKSVLFDYRFEILAFLFTISIFGGGVVPSNIFDDLMLPVIIFLAAALAVVMVQHRNLLLRLLFAGFAVLALLLMLFRLFTDYHVGIQITSLLIFILFFAALSFEVFRQMLGARKITHSIIFAAFDCYLLLGMLGAMLFTLLVALAPDSFSAVGLDENLSNKMIYFSFITLTSIGYGDITPSSIMAEKVVAFYGLIGHFYSVVIVGIIVGKYVAVRSEGND